MSYISTSNANTSEKMYVNHWKIQNWILAATNVDKFSFGGRDKVQCNFPDIVGVDLVCRTECMPAIHYK